MSDVLIAGAWRNGLGDNTQAFVAEAEKRRAAGFRQFPYESTVVALCDLLDNYDHLFETDTLDVTPVKKSK